MAWANAKTRGTFGNGSSLSLSFLSTPTVGSLITVAVSLYSATGTLGTGSVTDNQGNTYTRRQVRAAFVSQAHIALYDSVIGTASGTFTITVTPATAGGDICMNIAEFTGGSASPIDQSTNNAGSGTNTSSGNITPTEDNELLVAAMAHGGSDQSITEEGGWSLAYEHEGGSTSMPISAVYKVQTTATAEDADWTTGGVDWGAVIASYKVAGGTTQFISPTGSLTPSGLLGKIDNKPLSGNLTPAAILRRSTNKLVVGQIIPSGILSNIKAVIRLFAGSIVPAGNLTKIEIKGITGIVSPGGNLIKLVSKNIAGSLNQSGLLTNIKAVIRLFTGNISPSGIIEKRINKILEGNIAPQGSMFKVISKILLGAVSLLGLLTNLIGGIVTGIIHWTLKPRSFQWTLISRIKDWTLKARNINWIVRRR